MCRFAHPGLCWRITRGLYRGLKVLDAPRVVGGDVKGRRPDEQSELLVPKGLARREFVRMLAGTAASSLALPLAGCGFGGSTTNRRVVVLGLDGLDPTIVKALIDMGRAPNFKKLAERGSFLPLATTMPALSPVAWSSFITGLTPGGHGIADFIARDPKTYSPVFSIYENRAPDITLDLGDLHLPVKGGGPVNLRRGKPFWAYLTERGIPSWVSRIPTMFPADETATYAITGMGTPDLTDAYGMFSYYTSDPFETYPNISGGTVHYVDVKRNVVRAELLGPENTLRTPKPTAGDPYANKAKLPFTVYLDPRNQAARIDINGRSVVVKKGEFSDWVKVDFELLPLIGTVSGIVRFLLKEVGEKFRLYITPINIDPENQAAPVTYPASLGADIARNIGAYWTKGLPADTKAFDYSVFKDEDYVQNAQLLLKEHMDMFDYLWSRFDTGLFYFYVSNTDQDAHMLWRNMDETHPMHARGDVRFAGYLHHLYERMDELVGKVLPALDDRTLLLVCSDHGFAQFGRQFHLNTWLRDNGYLTLKPGAEKKDETAYTDIDWKKTVAYGIGFNGLYLNRAGREAEGIVEASKAREIEARLKRDLEAISDSETGKRPVAKVYRRDEVYSGDQVANMPELLVGYTPGYRGSSASVLGATGKTIIDLNPWAWSGDHSMARDLVRGTLFSSQKVAKADPSILDLPVTILEFFGIDRPSQMVGRSIFKV
jgi:predicted AlkP superfamily phosphohydrolase/phosphomutase